MAVILSKKYRKPSKEFDAEIYKQRNLVERFFGRIKRSLPCIATWYVNPLHLYGIDQTGFIQALVRVYESAT